MNKTVRISILIALVFALFQTGANAQVGNHAPSVPATAKTPAARPAFAPKLPLFFEKNEGQADQRAGFLARMPDATLYLTGADAVLVHSAKAKDTASALRMHWAGASTTAAPVGEAELAARSNYFVGKEPSNWHTGIANFQRVKDTGLYPGVDLVYYGNQEQLEYDLTVQPGANASNIRLQIEGANKISLDKATGDLVVVDGVGSPLRLLKPVVYQIGKNNEKSTITGVYALSAHNTVSFVLGDYDHTRALVIDPQVVYSTVFGGTQKPAGGGGNPLNLYDGMTVDANGFVYISGTTSTINLPATAGAFQSGCKLYDGGQLCSNFYVAKFDPTQSGAASLIYATYIGGASQDNNLGVSGPRNDLAVDVNGDAYIVGQVGQGPNSWANDFPTTPNAFVQTCPGNGAVSPSCSGFLTKLNPAGSGLLYSTWTATSFTRAEPGMVAVDGNQIAYIAGSNGSGSPSNFLAAFDTTKNGAGSFVYSVGLPFQVQTIAADPSGNVYVGGETFQAITENGAPGYQLIILNGANNSVPSGSFPGILVRFNPAGQNTYATVFGDGGGGSGDAVRGVAADPDGIVYVTGNATDLVQVNGLPSGAGAALGAYVAEVDTTQTGPASLLFSSYIYATDTGNETFAVASNGAGQFAFAGIVGSSAPTYPVVNPMTQPVAFPTASPTNPQFIGMIDPSKSGQNALIFLSFIDGVDEAFTLAFSPGSNGDGGVGGGPFTTLATQPKPNAVGNAGPANYNLYVAGYGLEGLVNNPFLTGNTLASYSTSVSVAQEIVPFFYKIALGPIDCLTLSPNSLTFPSQELNTTSPPLPFTVTNTCGAAVGIDSVTTSTEFHEIDTCSPSLPAGQSCTVNVTFQPTFLSPFNNITYTPTAGTISVNATGSNAPLSEAVSGIGVTTTTATGFVSPQSIAFAPQPIGTVSAPVTVTLSNTGSVVIGNGVTKLIVLSAAASDPFSANTAIPSGCGTTLAVGASCQFQVVFAPTTTTAAFVPSGNYSVSLTVNGPSPTITMALTGKSVPAAPIATLSSTLLTFPSTTQGTPNGPQTVTLTNTGSATLTSIVVGAPAGANASSYSLGSGGCATVGSLAAGTNCSIAVTFTPQSAGTLTAMFTITDNATPGSQTVFLTGTGASSAPTTPTITWPTPAAITYGTALSATQLDATASVPGTFAYTPASGAVLTAGTQTLSVVFTPTDTTDFTTATTTVQLTVNKASPTFNWPVPAAITYGTALSATQLNATASVPGTFVYTPSSGSVLTAGTHTLSVVFTPTDSTDYGTINGTVQLSVGPAVPAITWSPLSPITYGTALGADQFNATASVPGTFAYTPSSGVLTAGAHTLQATFTPTDTTDYDVVTETVTLTVNQAAPNVSWTPQSPITYGTPLGAAQLNATASVPGTFVYTPSSGVLTAGVHALTVNFTPTDTTNYASITQSVQLTVNQAIPAITWIPQTNITYGTALGAAQFNATANIPGTFAYTPSSGVLTAGPHTITAVFTPTDTTDYTTFTETVQFTVSQAIPTITWIPQTNITYGTALGAAQFNATANIPGTFVYSPSSGVLTAGPHTITAAFTPTDTTDYTGFTETVQFTVNRATLTVSANSTSRGVGAANPAFTASYSGFVNGDTPAVLSGSLALSTTATTASPAGTYPITITQGTLAAANYNFTFVNGTLSVVTSSNIILTTTATLTVVTNGYQATVTVVNSGTGSASNVTLTSATLGSAAGTPVPQNVGTIAAGSSASFTIIFPASAGAPGTAVAEKYAGTYTGGSFAGSVRAAALP